MSTDRDVVSEVDGTTTYGTLHVPPHRDGQRLPAALLLAGSGPTDRDGNVPRLGVTPQTIGLIATVLGEVGVMSLRFDKYFSGQTGGGTYAHDPSALDLDVYIRQAAAAYQVLAGQPETSPADMLIAGHSEGGMYALLLARSVQPAPGDRVGDPAPRPGRQRGGHHHHAGHLGAFHRDLHGDAPADPRRPSLERRRLLRGVVSGRRAGRRDRRGGAAVDERRGHGRPLRPPPPATTSPVPPASTSPAAETDRMHQALLARGGDSRHVVLESSLGHGAFLFDVAGLARTVGDFLRQSDA